MVLNDVVIELAERFKIDPLRIGRPEAFDAAVSAVVALMPAPALIDEVVAMGGLSGARDPWGVVLARLRRIAELERVEGRSGRAAGRRSSADVGCSPRRHGRGRFAAHGRRRQRAGQRDRPSAPPGGP